MLSVMMSWGSGDAGFQHEWNPKAPCRYYLQGLGPNVGIIYRVRAPGEEEWNNDDNTLPFGTSLSRHEVMAATATCRLPAASHHGTAYGTARRQKTPALFASANEMSTSLTRSLETEETSTTKMTGAF